jgi:EAL domain-containing protein (putative c-di-GMP-specific phosphodiesterase class I)
VETEEQANFLRLLRCDEMQGYLFSKPVPNDALVALLRATGPTSENPWIPVKG